MMRCYQQLTYEKQRCQISVLKERGFSQREIAEAIGVSQSTVGEELSRNTGRGYRHKQASREDRGKKKSRIYSH